MLPVVTSPLPCPPPPQYLFHSNAVDLYQVPILKPLLPPENHMLRAVKFCFISLLIALAVALIAGSAAYNYIVRWSGEALVLHQPVVIDIPRSTSLNTLSRRLEDRGLVTSDRLFKFWVRYFDDYRKFQAGRYRFEGQVAPIELISTIVQGDIYTPIELQFTIPEGFTLRKIADRLAANSIGTADDIMALAKDENFLRSNNIPADHLEGYLYPATYPFSTRPTPKEALQKMVDTFWEKLPEGYLDAIKAKDLSLSEAVTFASLIEAETRLDDERALVSEVIWRRLKIKMALAIDASVIYGIKDYSGNITSKHLKDRSNRYNTRVHRGLPPSPICSPSVKSLEAVLTPTDHGYLYYVLDLKDGSRHHFSRSLKEHNKHVRELIGERRRQRLAKQSTGS